MANKQFIKKHCILFDFDGVIVTHDLKASIFRDIYREMECNSLQLKYVGKYHLENGISSIINLNISTKFFGAILTLIKLRNYLNYFHKFLKKLKIKIVKGFISAIKNQKRKI